MEANEPIFKGIHASMNLEKKMEIFTKQFMKEPAFAFEWYATELEMDYGGYAVEMFRNEVHNAKDTNKKLTANEIETAYNRLNEELKNGSK